MARSKALGSSSSKLLVAYLALAFAGITSVILEWRETTAMGQVSGGGGLRQSLKPDIGAAAHVTNHTAPEAVANRSASTVPPPSPSASRRLQKRRCALLFFGAPRLFRSVALPSIRKYVIAPNAGCDVFVHTSNATVISSKRSGEVNSTLHPEDVRELAPEHPSHVTIEPPENVESARDLPFFRKNHHRGWGWGPCCGTTENMIRQWHSIEGVWDLMEEHAAAAAQNQLRPGEPSPSSPSRPYYERVGLFRSDVFFTHPIEVEHSSEEAVVPDWIWFGRKAKEGEPLINDRMFYGTYENAKVWAKGRFPFAPSYVEHYKKSKDPQRQGIHAETFVYDLLVREHSVPLTLKPVCFWLARTTGMIMTNVCKIPDLPSTGGGETIKPAVSGMIRDPEDWAILQAANATCCWACRGSQKQPGLYGPCTPQAQLALQEKEK